MSTGGSSLVPLREVFLQARRAGFAINADLWDLLRGAGLIEPAVRLPGSKSYGIPRSKVERVMHVLAVKRRLPGRFLATKLAFELALEGDKSIPTCHIADEIERQLTSAFGFLRRGLTRIAAIPSRLSDVTETKVEKGAKRVAKRLLKRKRKHRRYRTYAKTIELGVAMAGKMIYERKPSSDFAHPIAEALSEYSTYRSPKTGLVGEPNQYPAALQLTKALSSLHSWLYYDQQRNALFRSLRTVPGDQLFRFIAVTPRIVRALIDGANEFADSLPTISASIVRRVVRDDYTSDFLYAVCLAGLIDGCNTPTVQELIEQVEADDLTRIREFFNLSQDVDSPAHQTGGNPRCSLRV